MPIRKKIPKKIKETIKVMMEVDSSTSPSQPPRDSHTNMKYQLVHNPIEIEERGTSERKSSISDRHSKSYFDALQPPSSSLSSTVIDNFVIEESEHTLYLRSFSLSIHSNLL